MPSNLSKEDEIHLALTLNRYKDAIRILALPASEQILSYPSMASKVSEMVTDFIILSDWAFTCEDMQLTVRQKELIQELYDYLCDSSHLGYDLFWAEDALHTSYVWKEVRVQAQMLMKDFNWPVFFIPDPTLDHE